MNNTITQIWEEIKTINERLEELENPNEIVEYYMEKVKEKGRK